MSPRSDENPAIGSLGLSLAVPPVLLLPLLPHGGLAPLAVAAAVAALLGVSTALAEWRSPPIEDGPVRSALDGLAELVGIGLVAVAAAALARTGTLGGVLAVLAWPVGMLLGRRPVLAGLAGLLAVGLAVAGAGLGLVSAAPWTLLRPEWDAASAWLGPALVAGVQLAGAATGQFSVGPARRPGQRRAPWALAGAGVLLATALAVTAGSRFEATLGASPGADPIPVVALGLALVSGVAALGRRTALGGATRGIGGLAATLWLALAGAAAAAWVAIALLPLLGAASLLVRAFRPQTRRVPLVTGGLVLLGGTLLARPGLPVHAGDAVAIGVLLVAGFWVVATRTVLARGAA